MKMNLDKGQIFMNFDNFLTICYQKCMISDCVFGLYKQAQTHIFTKNQSLKMSQMVRKTFREI